MTRRIALILALAAFAQDARGDVAPFPRINNGEVRLLVENLDEFGDFDFYVRYRPLSGPGHPEQLTKIQAQTAVKLVAIRDYRFKAFLVAVPKGEVITIPKNEVAQPPLKPPPIPGTIQSEALFSDTGGPLASGHFHCEITYRIHLADGELQAECIDASRPGLQLGLMVFGGFAVALVLLLVGGVFLALKIRSRRSPAS